ncbi:Filamentous hemagglutinin [Yokenella regensburgei]|nr:Filamentous hemagglutinin [Yokenella regensburgei]
MEKKLLTLLIGAVLSNQSIAKQNTTENNKNYSTSHILVSIEDVSSPWLLDGDSSAITGLAYPNYWSSPNNLIIAGNLNKRASVIYLGSDGTLHKQDLGTLRSDNSGESNVSAISNDGTTIVGSSDHDNSRLKTGYVSLRNADGSYGKMTPLGSLTSGGPGVNPYAVSSSGNLIVGSGFSRQGVEHLGDYINHAFYSFRNDDGSYQAPQEVAGFGGFTGERSSTAYGVGKLVFGGSNEFLVGGMNHLMEKDSKEQAFIAYKIKDKNEFYHAYSLGSLIGSSGWSEARGTDGSSAIVGASDNIRGGKSAFVSLLQATIKENSMSSNPNGMDDSGNSYKWHMIDLGTAKINNTGSSTALAISPDAEVIVGESANDKTTENQAFFTYRIGVKDRIADFETKDFSKPVTLGSLKSDGGGWSTATSITRSVDGFIVGGQSDTDSGNKHSFLVRLKANDYFEPLPPPVVESTDTVPPLIPDPPAPEPVPPAPEPVPPVPEPVPPVPEPVPPAPEPVPPVPEPVPPAPEPVPPAPEPVPPAPEPVPPAPEPVPPAPEPVPPAPAPDVTPSKLVDIDNTFNSIEKNAKNLNTLLSLKQYQLRDLMDRDCSSEFGNYCVWCGFILQ